MSSKQPECTNYCNEHHTCANYDVCSEYASNPLYKPAQCTCHTIYNGIVCNGFAGGDDIKCTSDFNEDYNSSGICNGHSDKRPNLISELTSTHPVKNSDIVKKGQINAIYNKLIEEIKTRQKHIWYKYLSNFPLRLNNTKTIPVDNNQIIYKDILNEIAAYSKMYDEEHTSIGANGPSKQEINSNIIMYSEQENTLSSIFMQTRTDCICYGDCASYSVCTCYGNCNYY